MTIIEISEVDFTANGLPNVLVFLGQQGSTFYVWTKSPEAAPKVAFHTKPDALDSFNRIVEGFAFFDYAEWADGSA